MANLKKYILGLSPKKRLFRLLFVVVPLLLFTGFLIFMYTIPGDKGLFTWTDWVREYFIYLIIFDVALFALLGTDVLVAAKRKAEIKRLPSRVMGIFLILGVVISLGGFGFLGTVPLRRAGDKAPQLLVLDGVGANGAPNMAVCFYTQEKTSNTFKWGLTPSLELGTKVDVKESKVHGFLLDELNPGSTYFYQINDGDVYSFNTPVPAPNTARFAIASDSHFGADNANRSATQGIMESIVDNNFDMFYHLGDMVEYGLFDAEYKEAMDYLSPYTTQVPFRPAIGNHDTMFGGKTLWRDYFSPDLLEESPRDYFHINQNGIHVFVLDLEWGTETYNKAQKDWFEGELDLLSEDDWILVMNHAMYYSSGYYTGGEPWWDNQDMIDAFEPLFIEHDVDLVFSGHNHHMEILNNSGVVYSIIGTLGGHADPDYQTKDQYATGMGSIWYQNGTHGFLDVDISGNTAQLTFRTPEYAVVNSFTVLE